MDSALAGPDFGILVRTGGRSAKGRGLLRAENSHGEWAVGTELDLPLRPGRGAADMRPRPPSPPPPGSEHQPSTAIVARVRPDNVASKNVALKAGLRRDGDLDDDGEDGPDDAYTNRIAP